MEHMIMNGLAGFGGVGVFYAITKGVLWLNTIRKAAIEAKEAATLDAAIQAHEIESLKEQVKIGDVLNDLHHFLQVHAPVNEAPEAVRPEAPVET